MKNRHSPQRNWGHLSLFMIGLLVIVIYRATFLAQQFALHQANEQAIVSAQLATLITRNLSIAIQDATALATSNTLRNAADAGRNLRIDVVRREIVRTLTHRNGDLSRISFADQNGQELVRATWSADNGVRLTPREEPYDYSECDYVKRSLSLISPHRTMFAIPKKECIHDASEPAPAIVLTTASPVLDTEGGVGGVLIAEINSTRLLNPLMIANTSAANFDAYLSDNSGKTFFIPKEQAWRVTRLRDKPNAAPQSEMSSRNLSSPSAQNPVQRVVGVARSQTLQIIDLQQYVQIENLVFNHEEESTWHLLIETSDDHYEPFLAGLALESGALLAGAFVLLYAVIRLKQRGQELKQVAQRERDLQSHGTDYIIQLIPEPILIVDEHGTIITANDACGELMRYSKSALRGLNVDSFVPGISKRKHKKLRTSYVEAPRQVVSLGSRVLSVLNSDGERIPVSISLNYQWLTEGMRVVCVLSPRMNAAVPAEDTT